MNTENPNSDTSDSPGQAAQTPVSDPKPLPKTPNLWMFSSVVLFVLLLVSGFYAYTLSRRLAALETASTPSPTATPEVQVKKTTLSEAISKFCKDNKIPLTELPFSLSTAFKSDYGIEDNLLCYLKPENYASFTVKKEANHNVKTTYFFSPDSVWQGQGNNFQPLESYRNFMVEGVKYYLEVMDPDPYGISTLSIWIQVIGEKKNVESGTTVRVFNFFESQDPALIELVKKYGVKQSSEGSPEYIIMDPTNKKLFIDEVVKLAPGNKSFTDAAKAVNSDMNSISF